MSYIQNEFLKVQADFKFKWITYKRKSSAEDIHPESNIADVQAKESLGTRNIYGMDPEKQLQSQTGMKIIGVGGELELAPLREASSWLSPAQHRDCAVAEETSDHRWRRQQRMLKKAETLEGCR
jgi:hypothetical protein